MSAIPALNDTSVVQTPISLMLPEDCLDENSRMCSDAVKTHMVDSDMNNFQEKKWEMNHVNDVSMSDIHRAVSSFITGPGSSTQGGVFPKQEPEADSWEHSLWQSNANNTVDITLSDILSRPSENSQKNSWINDVIQQNVMLYVDDSSGQVDKSASTSQSTSCFQKNVFPKQELKNDLWERSPRQSKANNTVDITLSDILGRPSQSSHTNTWINDVIPEHVMFYVDESSGQVDKSASTSESKSCFQKVFPKQKHGDLWERSLCQSNTNKTDILGRPSETYTLINDVIPQHVMFFDDDSSSQVDRSATTSEGSSCLRKVVKLKKCSSTASSLVTQPRGGRSLYFVCPIKECNEKLPTKRDRDTHVMAFHREEGFRCTKCDKRFTRMNYLEQHDNEHKGIKPYKCKKCGKKFHSHRSMTSHCRQKHIESKNKQCEICGIVLNSSEMSKHRLRTHLKIRHQCQECNQNFRLVRYLKDHMRMHRGDEPYKCDLCAKTFVQKAFLVNHLKCHSRTFQCPKCDKSFKCQNYLKHHLLEHEGIKKFCCNECGKTFSHSHYLFAHKLSHGEKGFECGICGGKFNRKDNLKAHIIRHSKTGKISFKKR